MFDDVGPSLQVSAPTRRQMICGAALACGSLGFVSAQLAAASTGEISRGAESLHQELVFKASRKRVYEILTGTELFDKMTHEIQAKEASSTPDAKPTAISREVGGTFTLFGGRIVGRHLELVPNERIVQAWRVAYWKSGIFSIVRFDLVDAGAETKILFDHTGFSNGDAENLLGGWKLHYWQPLEKFLA